VTPYAVHQDRTAGRPPPGRVQAIAALWSRPETAAARPADKDDSAARAIILEVYKVLTHPQRMNCHPSGDSPLEGDGSQVHVQNVKRGGDGMGKYALKCVNSHQDANLPGANMPPGNPTWHLPRKDMPLVFQGKCSHELADQLKDPKRKGGKSLREITRQIPTRPGSGNSPRWYTRRTCHN
jgi:hypothetical protein